MLFNVILNGGDDSVDPIPYPTHLISHQRVYCTRRGLFGKSMIAPNPKNLLDLVPSLIVRMIQNIFFQFENGKCFEALTIFCDERSNLVAIVVIGLNFEPKKVKFSEHNADQYEEVIHIVNFDK